MNWGNRFLSLLKAIPEGDVKVSQPEELHLYLNTPYDEGERRTT